MQDRPDLDKAFQFFNEIGILSQLSNAVLQSVLPDGLHPSHFAILNHLSKRSKGQEPARLAAAMQVTKATMTHSLKVLQNHGLIVIHPNPDDARSKQVLLSARGFDVQREAIARVMAKFSTLMTDEISAHIDQALPSLIVLRKHLDSNR